LTMKRYGKARLSDLGTAIEKLPLLRPIGPTEQQATGTEGRLVAPLVRLIQPPNAFPWSRMDKRAAIRRAVRSQRKT
jgi:hypothetical protein